MDSNRSLNTASSSRHTQMPDIKKKAMAVNSSYTKLFPFISRLQRSTYSYRVWTYIQTFFVAIQHLLVPMFCNFYPDSKVDFYLTAIFMFVPNSSGKTYTIESALVLAIGYFCSVFMIIVTISFYVRNTISKVAAAIVSIIMHLIIPIIVIPTASIIGSALDNLLESQNKTQSTIFIVLGCISWVLLVAITFFNTTFSASTVFFHDSISAYFNGQPIFYSLVFNSLILFFTWVSDDLNEYFSYFLDALHIVLDIFLLYWTFQFPFCYLYINAEMGATMLGCIFVCIGFFIRGSFVPLRPILGLVGWLVGFNIFYFTLKIYAKKIMKRTEFKNRNETIKQLRLAVSFYDQSFQTGHLIENICQATNDFSVRLEVAKVTCVFAEFQAQFTAQLAMLRNATGLSISESFLFYILKTVETGRQPLCAVDELIPLRDETKKIEMSIRAAWKFMEGNCFIAPKVMEPVCRQVNTCEHHWKDALEKYPRNALLAEEYAHFLVECKSDFEGAAYWHFSALQLQDGKIFKYDNASLSFLHMFPEYANKILGRQQITTMDDLDVKAKEEALGQLVEHPRLRLEFQRALSSHVTLALHIMLVIGIIKFLAFFILFAYMGGTFYNMFSPSVDRMYLIKNSTDIGEYTALSMIGFALNIADQMSLMPTLQEMHDVIGTDRVVHDYYIIAPVEGYLYAAHEFTELGLAALVDVYNSMADSIVNGEDLSTSVNSIFTQKYPIKFCNDTFEMLSGGKESLIYIFSNYFLDAHIVATENGINSPLAFDSFDLAASIVDNLQVFARSFIKENRQKIGDFNRLNFFIVLIVYAAFFIAVDFILMVIYKARMQKTMMACKHFTPETFASISSNIFIAQISTDAPNNTATISKTTRSQWKSNLLAFFELLLTLILLGGIFAFMIKITEMADDFTDLGTTLLQCARRKSKTIESFYSLVCINILRSYGADLSREYQRRTMQALNNLTDAQQQCAKGYYGKGSIYDKITQIQVDSPCSFSLSNATYHETLACLSLDSGVSAFYNMMMKLQNEARSDGFFTDETFIELFHYVNSHLYKQEEEIVDLLLDQGEYENNNANKFIVTIVITQCIMSFVSLLLTFYKYIFLRRVYRTMINFILRVVPTDAVMNDELMMNLLNRRMSQRNANMTDTATLLANTSHPLVFTTSDGNIVSVNSAFQVVFNYEISHIVGQNISMITDVDKLQKVFNYEETTKLTGANKEWANEGSQPNIDQENENETIKFEKIVSKWRRENGQVIECEVLPLVTGKTKKDRLFAFVVSDLSTVIAKQKKISILQSANDILQANLRPALLGNETEAKVGDATVCTIRLVQFSSSLAPAAVMKQRKSILSKLEECMKKYENIQRLFFAQGMFAAISNAPNATTDMFHFIDDVLASFDDPTFFGEITIGVDTGDTVEIAESKGDVKELAVIGNVFSNAARLSILGESGKACITERVYNQIASIGAKFVSKEDTIVGKYYSVEPMEV